MENKKFKTPYNGLYPKKLEVNSGEKKVETAGYLSAEQRITNLMLAGQRLVESRAQMYDFDGEVDEDFYDPTREKNFDMAEASMMKNDLEARYKMASKAKKKAQEEPKKGGEGEIPPPQLETATKGQ